MVNVSLSNSVDFVSFKGHTLENIVTREGRQPFPRFEFEISDLDPKECYQVSLSFRRHANTMNYIKNTWVPQFFSLCSNEEKPVMHEYGTATGEELMKKNIKFPMLKFTSDKSNVSETTIRLYNRHKYTPILHVYPMKQNCLGGYEQQEPEEFTFEDADFVTVSRYVNRELSEMKIKMNKYSSRFVEKRAGVQEEDSEKQKKRRRRVRAETESREQESAETAAPAKKPLLSAISHECNQTVPAVSNPPIASPENSHSSSSWSPVQPTPEIHGWNSTLPVTPNPYCVAFGNTNHSPAVHSNPPQYAQNNNFFFSYYSTPKSSHHQPSNGSQSYNQHLLQSSGYQGAFSAVQQVYYTPQQFQFPDPATYQYQQHPPQMIGNSQLDYQELYYSHSY